jgi:hypothetical protein
METRNHRKITGRILKSQTSKKIKSVLRMILKNRLFVLSFTALMFNSCTQRILDFTLVSSKNIDMSRAASFVKGNTRVKGVDMVHIIIFIPTGTINIKEAVDKAIESTPGCVALLDGVIYTKFFFMANPPL